MKKYNLFILLPNLDDQEVEEVKKEIVEIIKKVGAEIEKSSNIGKRKLSYAIKKVRHGFYLNYIINLELDKINDLKKELKLNQGILRFELSLYTKILKHKKTRLPLDNNGQAKTQKKNDTEIKKGAKDEKKEKVSMEELNKKLDNILKDNNKI